MVGSSTSQNPDFLLKDLERSLPWKETEQLWKDNLKTIQENMREVLNGLAHATQTYASGILEGDTSVFSTVTDYYVAKQKRLYAWWRKDDVKYAE